MAGEICFKIFGFVSRSFVFFFQTEFEVMSWLSDHLFGVPKSKDENNKDADGNASADSTPAPPSTEDGSAPSEIQNTAVTTSNSDAAAAPPSTDDATALEAYENRDVVAEWQVPVRGKLHQLEFEHGTTSGKRILWINGQVS